ncbi:acyltransferase ChoActase/COT/CPT [Xylaria sp. FL0933]|nr:acyltransferase ChoActase/COT/CPT [Xylaria sp. FL0933]
MRLGTEENCYKMGNTNDGYKARVQLPSYPLPTLEATTQHLLQAVACIGSEEEQLQIRDAAAEFLGADSVARDLQARLEELARAANGRNWIADAYSDSLWLRKRDWNPRCHHFYAWLPCVGLPQSQVDRAAAITKAAYDYKVSLDGGSVVEDHQRDLDFPQCMESVYWIFNSNRVPVLGCDRVDRWPGHNHVVVMKNGHAYKVPLCDVQGQTISYQKLRCILQAIADEAPTEPSLFNILTTANRDDWAKMRTDFIGFSEENESLISTLETSLFVVCLEDSKPTTFNERYAAFILDDSRNRWLDKTLSFIITANGEAALLCEHSKVDATPLYGLARAVINSTAAQVQGDTKPTLPSSVTATPKDYTCLRATVPPSLSECINSLQAQHLEGVRGWTAHHHALKGYSTSCLRRHRMSPKSVVQVVIQAALRRHFGYSPNTMDVVSLRHFKGGRVDCLNATTDKIVAFCDALWDQTAATTMEERHLMFSEAVRSHTRLLSLVTWGQGWWRHTTMLAGQLQAGEQLPRLFRDPLYDRVKRALKGYTAFVDFGLKDVGQCWHDRETIFMTVCVLENSVGITINNGNGRGAEFVNHLEEAARKIKEVLDFHQV